MAHELVDVINLIFMLWKRLEIVFENVSTFLKRKISEKSRFIIQLIQA